MEIIRSFANYFGYVLTEKDLYGEIMTGLRNQYELIKLQEERMDIANHLMDIQKTLINIYQFEISKRKIRRIN